MNATTTLIAELARLRRIECVARLASAAAATCDAQPCTVALLREREAMRELRKVLS